MHFVFFLFTVYGNEFTGNTGRIFSFFYQIFRVGDLYIHIGGNDKLTFVLQSPKGRCYGDQLILGAFLRC